MNITKVAVFALGVVAGVIIGMAYSKAKKDAEYLEEVAAEIDENVARMRVKREEPETPNEVICRCNSKRPPITRHMNEEYAEMEYPEDDRTGFEIISFEAYHYETDYEKTTISYYQGDNIMIDEDGELIEGDDHHLLIGDGLSHFGGVSADPDVVYVRNNDIGKDYEVVRFYENSPETPC